MFDDYLNKETITFSDDVIHERLFREPYYKELDELRESLELSSFSTTQLKAELRRRKKNGKRG